MSEQTIAAALRAARDAYRALKRTAKRHGAGTPQYRAALDAHVQAVIAFTEARKDSK